MKTHFIAVFLILQSGSIVSAQEASLGSCQIFGQVFGIDPLGGDLLVKSPSGDIGGIRFDKSTSFARASLNAGAAPSRITPAQVNAGDVICARGSESPTSVVMATSVALVASRLEIQKRQKENLADWAKSGLFGTIAKINRKEQSLILERKSSGGVVENLLVVTNPSTRFRQYLKGAAALSDDNAVSWEQIRVGEKLYVRGDRSADGTSIKARTILVDGFQALTGTIVSLDALSETLRVRELSSGKAIEVHISPVNLFLLNPGLDRTKNETFESPQGRKLQTLGFGDLQAGDSVVVVGAVDDDSGQMTGVALIADFGEVATKHAGEPMSWELGSMKLDLP